MTDTCTGRVWKFGHDINTDLIIPGHTVMLSIEEQTAHCFEAHRPEWRREVTPGDVVLAGRNFGVGGGRPIGAVLLGWGVSVVVAESFNGLGMRNCINAGLPVLPCAGILDAFDEGDVAEVDWVGGEVRNATKDRTLTGSPLPSPLRRIVEAGGVEAMLRREGYLAEQAGGRPGR